MTKYFAEFEDCRGINFRLALYLICSWNGMENTEIKRKGVLQPTWNIKYICNAHSYFISIYNTHISLHIYIDAFTSVANKHLLIKFDGFKLPANEKQLIKLINISMFLNIFLATILIRLNIQIWNLPNSIKSKLQGLTEISCIFSTARRSKGR